jgi:hypothetical protein
MAFGDSCVVVVDENSGGSDMEMVADEKVMILERFAGEGCSWCMMGRRKQQRSGDMLGGWCRTKEEEESDISGFICG